MGLRIKNWARFQHFKDRRPPWIKLHREMLDQRDINVISDCSFRVIIGLWLLASEDEAMSGNLPPIEDIAFRLRIDIPKLIKSLRELSEFLEGDDIKAISRRYQIDDPETETETETETEKTGSVRTAVDGLDVTSWTRWVDYRKKIRKPIKAASVVAAQKKLAAFGDDQAAVVDQSIAAGWQGLFAMQQVGERNAKNQQIDGRSRAKRHSDKLDEIARASIERERAESASGSLDFSDFQEVPG